MCEIGCQLFCRDPYQWFVHNVAATVEYAIPDHVMIKALGKTVPAQIWSEIESP